VISIQNNCTKLPSGAIWHLRQSLKWIYPVDLDGVDAIQLFERLPDPDTKSPNWHKHARAEGYNVNGLYIRRDNYTSAHIQLFINDIYSVIPSLLYWTSVPTLRIAKALAHEVGHHLLDHRGYIFSPDEKIRYDKYEEEMAERYALDVVRKMRGRWWYQLGNWLTRKLAGHQFVLGTIDYEAKRYKEASEHWYRAWVLDPDREDASRWRHHANTLVKSR
jgi:hypothetical protein